MKNCQGLWIYIDMYKFTVNAQTDSHRIVKWNNRNCNGGIYIYIDTLQGVPITMKLRENLNIVIDFQELINDIKCITKRLNV